MASVRDVIDTLVGIAPGSKLDAIRANRSEARKHAQASYASLFEPREVGGVAAYERNVIAAFVAGLRQTSPEGLAATTTANFFRLFDKAMPGR